MRMPPHHSMPMAGHQMQARSMPMAMRQQQTPQGGVSAPSSGAGSQGGKGVDMSQGMMPMHSMPPGSSLWAPPCFRRSSSARSAKPSAPHANAPAREAGPKPDCQGRGNVRWKGTWDANAGEWRNTLYRASHEQRSPRFDEKCKLPWNSFKLRPDAVNIRSNAEGDHQWDGPGAAPGAFVSHESFIISWYASTRNALPPDGGERCLPPEA